MTLSYRIPAVGRILILLLCSAFFSCGHENSGHTTSPNIPETDTLPTYEELARTNAAARLNQEGDSVFSMGEYHTATAFYQQSMDSAAVQADSFLYYDSKLDLACVHDRLGEAQKAIEMTEPIVEALIRGGDSTRIGRAYTALAGFYSKANLPEKSRIATRKGFGILKQQGPLTHRAAAYNQMAFTYSDQGDWARALPLLDTALQLMVASGTLIQCPGMYLNIGNCHRNLGNWVEARHYLKASAASADSLGQAHVLARAMERLSQVAEATNDPTSALNLFRRAKTIRDSLFTAEKTHSLQELTVQYETREKEQEIILLRATEQLQRSERNLLLACLVFLLVLFGLILFIQRLKLRNARQSMAQKQQEMADYVELLQVKNAQLADFERNRQPVSYLPETETNHADPEGDPSESWYNNRILTDRDWESFKHRFERIYPGYLLRLRTRYPELSGAEERLCLLLKINLNSQEIATSSASQPMALKRAGSASANAWP